MEIIFYEKIGIRLWKKFVLWLMSQFIGDLKDRRGGNYYLDGLNLEAVKKFKKMLYFNALIHTFALIECSFFIITSKNSFSTIFQIIFFFINLYCVMLQRYNWLRIKKVLKKAANR